MKTHLQFITLLLFFQACKAPEVKELKSPITSSQFSLINKFQLTDPMVHVGLQTAIVTNDGTVLANENENIKVWNYGTKTLLKTLKGHQKLVIDMVLSPDETKLYSAGLEEGDILVWDWKQGTFLKRLQGHTAQVNCLRISADGKFLASVSMDGTIKIWDAQNLTLVRTITGIEQNKDTKVTIFNNAKYVAVLQSKSFVVYDGQTGAEYWRKVDENNYQSGPGGGEVGQRSTKIYLYSDIILDDRGENLFFWEGGFDSWDITKKDFSDIQKMLTFGEGKIAEPGSDDIPIKPENNIFSNINKVSKNYQSRNDSKMHIVGSNVLTYKNYLFNNENPSLIRFEYVKNSVYVSSDKTKMLVRNGENFHIRTGSGYQIYPNPYDPNHPIEFGSNIKANTSVQNASCDNKLAYLSIQSSDNSIIQWSTSTDKSDFMVSDKNLPQSISNSTNRLLSQSNGFIRLYETKNSVDLIKEIASINGFISTQNFSHNGQLFYADSKIFNANDASKKLDLPIIEGIVIFTSDDKKLVNLNSKGEIKEFDVNTGKEVRSFLTVANDDYMRLAISGDDKEVAIATSKEILIYNLTEGKLLGSFSVNPIFTLSNTIAYNPNQKVIAVATLDKKVQLWNSTTRQLLSEQRFDFDIVDLQFNQDGKSLNVVTLKDYYQFSLN